MRLVLTGPMIEVLESIEDGRVYLDDDGEAMLIRPGHETGKTVTRILDEFEDFFLFDATLQSRVYVLTPRGKEVMDQIREAQR